MQSAATFSNIYAGHFTQVSQFLSILLAFVGHLSRVADYTDVLVDNAPFPTILLGVTFLVARDAFPSTVGTSPRVGVGQQIFELVANPFHNLSLVSYNLVSSSLNLSQSFRQFTSFTVLNKQDSSCFQPSIILGYFLLVSSLQPFVDVLSS